MKQNKKEQHIRFSQNTVANIARQLSDILNLSNNQTVRNKQPAIKPMKLAEYIQQKSENRKKYNFMGSSPQAIAQEQYNKKTRKKKNELCQIIEQAIKFLNEMKISIMRKSDLKMLQKAQPMIRQLYESIGKSHLYESRELINNENSLRNCDSMVKLNSSIENKKNPFQKMKLSNKSYIQEPKINKQTQIQDLSKSTLFKQKQMKCSNSQTSGIGINFFKLLSNKQNYSPQCMRHSFNINKNESQNQSIDNLQEKPKLRKSEFNLKNKK